MSISSSQRELICVVSSVVRRPPPPSAPARREGDSKLPPGEFWPSSSSTEAAGERSGERIGELLALDSPRDGRSASGVSPSVASSKLTPRRTVWMGPLAQEAVPLLSLCTLRTGTPAEARTDADSAGAPPAAASRAIPAAGAPPPGQPAEEALPTLLQSAMLPHVMLRRRAPKGPTGSFPPEVDLASEVRRSSAYEYLSEHERRSRLAASATALLCSVSRCQTETRRLAGDAAGDAADDEAGAPEAAVLTEEGGSKLRPWLPTCSRRCAWPRTKKIIPCAASPVCTMKKSGTMSSTLSRAVTSRRKASGQPSKHVTARTMPR